MCERHFGAGTHFKSDNGVIRVVRSLIRVYLFDMEIDREAARLWSPVCHRTGLNRPGNCLFGASKQDYVRRIFFSCTFVGGFHGQGRARRLEKLGIGSRSTNSRHD